MNKDGCPARVDRCFEQWGDDTNMLVLEVDDGALNRRANVSDKCERVCGSPSDLMVGEFMVSPGLHSEGSLSEVVWYVGGQRR